MTVYSYSQIEQIWIRNGGSRAMAPLMAAIAMVESSGNDQAENPSGATGLWQLEWPLYANYVPGATSRDSYKNADINAKAAVKLSQNNPSTSPGSPVYNNWIKWETPVDYYKHFLSTTNIPGVTQAPPPGVAAPAGSDPTGGATSGGPGTSDPVSADSLGVGGLLKGAEGLLHGTATVLDYFFGMFGRGQGWRLIFTLVAGIALFASYKELGKAGVAPRLIPRKVI